MKSIRKYYRVDKRRIGFLKFIFEAHDGIAVITTLDAKTGEIFFTIPPGCLDDVETILSDLKKEISIEAMEESSEKCAIAVDGAGLN